MATTKHERITVDPRVMVGKPVIKGTRITVESLLRKIAAGWGMEEILEAHPHLKAEDVYAAAAYAADTIANEDIELSQPHEQISG
jgi:uncharacterized protein (DUF433 family)